MPGQNRGARQQNAADGGGHELQGDGEQDHEAVGHTGGDQERPDEHEGDAAAGGGAGLVLVAPAGLVPARVAVSLRPALPWLWHPTEARTERVLSFLSGGAPLPDRRHLVEWMTLVPEHARSSLAPAPLPNAVLTAWRDTPCVVLAGRRDPIFPAEELTRPTRMLLGARVEFVADAGHLLAHSHPDAVRRGITAPAGPGAG